jgi:Dolichyl-phosphate-mannose-protein mannosyltransferase
LLFLPMIAIAFLWARQLYNTAAAWLATVLLVFEPTFAAHLSLASIDALGAEGIVIGCYFAWRYFQRPSWPRAIAMCFFVALAMLLKHTAVIFPAVLVVFAIVWRAFGKSPRAVRAAHVMVSIALIPIFMWIMLGFDFSRPYLPLAWSSDPSKQSKVNLLDHSMPLGMYFGSLATASEHAQSGFLFGHEPAGGHWYYFPVVATYKVPIGFALLALLAIGSLAIARPRLDELSLLMPLVAWAGFLMASGVNIGWRHFLPAYAFVLLLSTRVMLCDMRWRIAGCVLAAIGAVHAACWHPNYLSYFNFPRSKPYLAISDSNVDWGQGIRQVRAWILAHPDARANGRRVYVRLFCRPESPAIARYLSNLPRVTVLQADDPLPKSGLLILSSVIEAGARETADYTYLQKSNPQHSIGGASLHVYDLDRVKGWKQYVLSLHRTGGTMPATSNPTER